MSLPPKTNEFSSSCNNANARLAQQNETLERKVRDHRSFWILAIAIIPSLVLMVFHSVRSREVWEGANRCQTLRWMARAAHSNLSIERDEKTVNAVSSLDIALSDCTPYDFGDGPEDE